MTRERWIALAVGVATVIITLLLLALLERNAGSQTHSPCISAEDQDKILRMSLSAIDQAFQHHVNNLFSNWVLDASQQPTRAQKGMQNGIKAWLRAQEDAKKWLPTICQREQP